MSLFVLIVSVIVVFICKAILTCLARSRSFIPEMALRHFKCLQVSAIFRMSALYSLSFRCLLIQHFCQIGIYSLPNAAEASVIRLLTSSEKFGTTLPRNTNSLTCLTLLLSVWYFLSVFQKLQAVGWYRLPTLYRWKRLRLVFNLVRSVLS